MPNVSRPDLLPLARPVRIGLPFHGRCTNSKLTLPDATEVDYLQPDGSDLTYVEHPKAAIPTRTPEEIAYDTERNYQWLPYAYVSGLDRQIGSKTIRTEESYLDYDYWLYCSENRTFLIRCRRAQVSSTVTLTISALEFGRFGVKESAYAWIGAHSFFLKNYDDDAVTATTAFRGVTHSKTGAITVINLAAAGFDESFGFAGAVKVELSGDALDELAVVATTICSGSQIATVTVTDESVHSYFYDNGPTVCSNIPYGFNAWGPGSGAGDVQVTVTDYYTIPDFPATTYSEYTYNFVLNAPLDGYTYDTIEVDAKVYYYVTPAGTVSFFDATYITGSTADLSATVPGESVSGSYKSVAGQPNEISPSVFVEGTASLNFFDGLRATVAGESWTVEHIKTCETDISIEWDFNGIYTTSFLWGDSYFGRNYQSVSAVVETWGATGTYQPQFYEFEVDEINVNGNDKPYVSYYCNNILDVYHYQKYGDKYHYLYSVTISGKTFSRFRDRFEGSYRLYPALWDPRTDAVYIGSPGDSMSIV